MLETWLEIDISATWRKLIEVIDSPAVLAACNASTIIQVVMPTETNAGIYFANIHRYIVSLTQDSCIKNLFAK